MNACGIIFGTVLGLLLHKGIKEKYKTILYNALGLATLAIGFNATLSHFPESRYPVLFILSLALGGVVGTALDIDGRFKRVVERKSNKGSAHSLSEGLSTALLLYCIGPLSMLGPVMSALKGDNTFLFTNATLDFVSSIVFASTYGVGMMLTAPVLFCWQGMFYVMALATGSAIGSELMAELLIIGGLLITGSGLSLLGIKDCKTLNLLPALLVPIVWFAVKPILGM